MEMYTISHCGKGKESVGPVYKMMMEMYTILDCRLDCGLCLLEHAESHERRL